MSPPGQYSVGPDRGRLILRTSRQGLATQAGHDLVIEVTRWSGEVVLAEDPAAGTVSITAEVGSLAVRGGTGGLKPLSDRDRLDIAQTARALLQTDLHPQARFTSTAVRPGGTGGVLDGTLTLLGVDRPLRLEITGLGGGRYRAAGRVVQSEYGIRPYSAFLGALKLADPVAVEAELDLSGIG
jgi:polyisoprenoid-binding protein YceI